MRLSMVCPDLLSHFNKSDWSQAQQEVSGTNAPGIKYWVPGIRYQAPVIRYHVSGTKYQVSNIGYEVSGTKHQVSGIRYQVPRRRGTEYQVPRRRGTAYQVPSTRYQVPGTRYQVPSNRYQVSGIRSQVPGTRYQVPSTRYQVSGTRYQVPSTRHQVSGLRYQVPGTRYQLLSTLNQWTNNKFYKIHRMSEEWKNWNFQFMVKENKVHPKRMNKCKSGWITKPALKTVFAYPCASPSTPWLFLRKRLCISFRMLVFLFCLHSIWLQVIVFFIFWFLFGNAWLYFKPVFYRKSCISELLPNVYFLPIFN